MDVFYLKLALVGMALSLLPCQLPAQEDDLPKTISLEAQETSIDGKSNKFVIQGLRISQGNWSIEADDALATGLDFDQNEWQFSGNVRITIDTAIIAADRAAFLFEANQLVMGELSGNPALFEDLAPEGEGPIRGGANSLYYNHVDGTVRLGEGASLTLGPNAVTGCDLIYDMHEERLRSGSSDCGEPFRITIIPPAEEVTANDPSPLP